MSELARIRVLDGTVDIGLEDAVELDDGTHVVELDELQDVEDTLRELEEEDYIEVLDWDYQSGYSGPPEQVRLEDGRIGLAFPDTIEGTEETDIGIVELYRVKCQRCHQEIEIELEEGGEFREPKYCTNSECDRQGPFEVLDGPDGFDLKEGVSTDPIWEPPMGIQEASMSELWGAVRDYLQTYWKSRDRPYLYDGLTAFTISTWFRPELDFVPHLLVFGKHETGKTRLLRCLKNLSYRGVLSVSVTEAAMFRSIDYYDTSYYISEYHDIRREKRDAVDQVIKAGQKREEIIPRAIGLDDGGYDVEKFDPFTHIAIGSQFEPRDDIVSRCLVIQTKPASGGVPFNPHDPTDLREKLLYTRFNYLGSAEWKLAEKEARDTLEENGVYGRLAEKLYGLLTVAELADKDITEFVDKVVEKAEEADAESEDALVIQSIIYAAYSRITDGQDKLTDGDPWKGLKIKYDDVVQRYEEMTGEEKSNSWLGHVINRLGLETSRYEDGTWIDDGDLKRKLKELAEENHVDWESTQVAYGINEQQALSSTQSSQHEDMETVLEIVRDQEDSGGAHVEDVVSEAASSGLSEERVRSRIEELKRTGEIVEPREGVIRCT